METEHLKNTIEGIQSIHPLSDRSMDLLLDKLETRQFKKGAILFHPETRHNSIHFIERGIMRAYLMNKGKEITFWLGSEGDIVFPYQTYVQGERSYETVQLLEDCELNTMLISDMEKLYKDNHELSEWGRKLAEKELVSMEQRFISYQFKTAKERYNQLISEKPEIFNRVQLRHIASYLGITQVSLSRIRGER